MRSIAFRAGQEGRVSPETLLSLANVLARSAHPTLEAEVLLGKLALAAAEGAEAFPSAAALEYAIGMVGMTSRWFQFAAAYFGRYLLAVDAGSNQISVAPVTLDRSSLSRSADVYLDMSL